MIDQLGPELTGYEASEQRLVDRAMLDLDGTDNKGKIGANAILGVSLAVAHAAAHSADLPLYRYVGGPNAHLLPVPMMNIVNGGAHADSDVDVQEFMIARSRDHLREQWSRRRVSTLKAVLKKQGLATGLGDEAASPRTCRPTGPTGADLHCRRSAGLRLGRIALALDVASSSSSTTARKLGGGSQVLDEMTAVYEQWLADFPIVSIEDPLAGTTGRRSALMGRIGDRVQVVGDDLLVTNVTRLQRSSRRRRQRAGQGEPDRLADRTLDAGPGPPRQVPLHDEPPVR